MKEIIIYEHQLDTIIEALRLTANLNDSYNGKTCYDRQVRQAYQFAKNVKAGNKDTIVNYATGLNKQPNPKHGNKTRNRVT